jgi:hypothetical protein
MSLPGDSPEGLNSRGEEGPYSGATTPRSVMSIDSIAENADFVTF